MVRQFRVILLLAGLCLLPLFAMGRDIVVSTDGAGAFRSIQRAIDASAYGDVILVNPGIYEETITLSSGITLRGSGPSHTIVRSSYGYQPVVQGTVVGSVLIEGIKFERTSSILEAVVVDLQSSQIVFRDCRITGGQLGGIRSAGLALLSFENCDIDANLGVGLQVSAASELTIRNCRITSNGSVGLYLRDAQATIENSIFQWNEWEGIKLEGAARVEGHGVTLSGNGRWGLSMLDSSQANLVDCVFSTQALGNISLDELASLVLERGRLKGGIESSISAQGQSNVQIKNTQITDAAGDGLRLADSASVLVDQSVVARCAGDGLSLDTEGDCRLQRVTIAYNGGHGLEFHGSEITVIHSIFALNGGVGLKVLSSSGADRSMQFDYNNVWGNRAGDYLGIHRSSSDTSVAPEFADPESGSLMLSTISPCIAAGAFGEALGAHGNPDWSGGVQMGLSLARTETDWGALEAGIQWDASSLESLVGHIAWEYGWGIGQAEISTSLSGVERLRTQGSVVYSPSPGAGFLGGALIPAFQVVGVLDGAASRWEASGSVRILADVTALRIGGSFEGPTGLTRQEIELTSRTFSLSGRSTNFTITDLGVGWEDMVSLGSISPTVGIDLRLVPELRLAVNTRWHLQDGTIQFNGRTYLQQLGTSSFSLSWSNGVSTRASVALQLRSGVFENGEVRASVRMGSLDVTGSLGASLANGPRCRLDVSIDTNQWFLPRINQLPIPAYSHTPFEPEAGVSVKFDASSAHDLDGELDQIWWDFGDGGNAIGRVVEHIFREPGDYTLTLTISDDKGAVTSLVETFHVNEPRTTPIAAFIWAPVSEAGARLQRPLRAGDRVLLDAADSYDPDGALVEYGWDLQSDGVFDHTSSESQIIIDPLSAGTWPVTLRIVDQAGNSDAVMRVLTIEELKPPEARFEISPASPAVADPIRFVDRSIEWDGKIISWEWDFGDGATSNEREPNHRYLETGDFEVLLTVRDTEGLEATARQIIAVRANPELVSVGRVWALVIGISNYLEVDDLSYADRDAKSMAEWLLSSGIPSEQIRWLTDKVTSLDTPTGDPLESGIATLVNVREGLGWLRQRATRDDLVLIHFSGHGYQGADDNLDERDGVDEFFVLYDTLAAAKDDTALRDDEFGRFLDRIESDHVLVFFDSCYSGGLSRSLTPGSRASGDVADVFSDFNLEGRLVLSASSESQDAFESPELQHGVLTHFLLEGLNGAGDLNGDQHVTIWELFEYVRAEVPSFVEAERGEIQVPQLIGEGEARVVLARPQSAEPPND